MKLGFLFGPILIFEGAFSQAQTLPKEWGELKALPPNVASYIHMGTPPQTESSVTLQIHPDTGKVKILHDQFVSGKLPNKFGKLKLVRKEKIGRCDRVLLEHTDSKLPQERQTWCFEKTKAWVVVERGPWRLDSKFISELLRKHGWDAKP